MVITQLYTNLTYLNISHNEVPVVYNCGSWHYCSYSICGGLFSVHHAGDRFHSCQPDKPLEQQFMTFSGTAFMDQHQQWNDKRPFKHWVPIQQGRNIEIAHIERCVIIEYELFSMVQLAKVLYHIHQTHNNTLIVFGDLQHVTIIDLHRCTTYS